MTARSATPQDRLRLLRDCGAALIPAGDTSFDWLITHQLAELFDIPASPLLACKITAKGREAATRLGPFS